MTEAISSKSIKFTKFDGESTYIHIVGEKYLLSGAYGRVYQADTLVFGRPRKFILKKFKGNSLEAQRNTRRALDNYQRAKEAGLKVFPTYRIGEDRRSILMTDGHGESTVCLSNNRSLPELGLPKIRDEAIPLTLTDAIIEQARRASEHKILIPNDAYFFLFNQRTQTTDFVIGDLDVLGKDIDVTHAFHHNLITARNSLLSFMALNTQNSLSQLCFVRNRFAEEGINRN